jgi:sigma-E factor negative regulatory protein RseC
MTQNGVIRKTGPDGFAEVCVTQRTACGHSCEDCRGCAAGSRELLIRARNPLEARAGETVTVASQTRRVLGDAALVYVLPLALMLASALLCASVGGSQTACALSAVLALAAGSALAVFLGRVRHRKAPLEYVIVERTGPRPGE